MTVKEAWKRAEELNAARPGGSMVSYVAKSVKAAFPHNEWGVVEHYQDNKKLIVGPVVS